MKLLSSSIIFRLIFCTIVSFNLAIYQNVMAESNAQEEPPRWFEIEVILYKLSDDSGLNRESWATDIIIENDKTQVDFLQPFSVIENINSFGPLQTDNLDDTNQLNELNNIEISIQTKQPPLKIPSTTEEQQIDEPQIELPFALLDKEFLQLTNEAKSISVNPRYNLLAHFAWRQPVGDKSEAADVRVAGGFDYHENYEYNGEKKIEDLQSDANFNQERSVDGVEPDLQLLSDELDDAQYAVTDTKIESNVIALPSEINIQSLEPDISSVTEQQILLPVALPWVPEIDGHLKVYIYRNFLHVDADLLYRHPGKEEIDIFSLGSQLQPLEQLEPIVNNGLDIDVGDPINSLSNDFTWQYDGDFLNQETEKTFIEKLFNYPLKQTRRMRSTELHYFDHPLIGMLVIIRPYQININDSEDDPEQENALGQE